MPKYLKLNRKSCIVYVDASRQKGNAGIAAILYDRNESGWPVDSLAERIGGAEKTVPQAEYMAVLFGLRLAQKHEYDIVEILSDAQLIVNQINGSYACAEPTLRELLTRVKAAAGTFRKVMFQWIPREQNEDANNLAQEVTLGE